MDYNGLYRDLVRMRRNALESIAHCGHAVERRIESLMNFAEECRWFANDLYVRGYGS